MSSARFAFLIVAHARPLQLARLIGRLSEDGDACFVHLDAKVDPAPFLAAASPGTAFLSERHIVNWGGFGMVEATMSLIEAALASDSYDRLCLLSVGCYPARPIRHLKQHCNNDLEYIGSRAMDVSDPKYGRYDRYYLIDHPLVNPRSADGGRPAIDDYQRFVERFLLEHGVSRPEAHAWRLHAGSTYWTLSAAAAEYLLREFRGNHYWRQRYRYTYIPEEVVAPTILAHSPFASRTVGNLHYIDWTGKPAPKLLTADDLPAIRASQRFFVRKTEPPASSSLCDQLDAWCVKTLRET